MREGMALWQQNHWLDLPHQDFTPGTFHPPATSVAPSLHSLAPSSCFPWEIGHRACWGVRQWKQLPSGRPCEGRMQRTVTGGGRNGLASPLPGCTQSNTPGAPRVVLWRLLPCSAVAAGRPAQKAGCPPPFFACSFAMW